MATGRSINKYSRVYINGYDMSSYTRSIGPLSWVFAEGPDDPISADVVGTWLGQASISPGTLNGIFDNTATSGIHTLLATPPATKKVMVAQGIQAVPAAGDPVFCGIFRQDDYITDPSATPSALTIKFGPNAGDATSDATPGAYAQPWGLLIHALGAVTASTDGTGIDSMNYGYGTSDPTTDGGYMMYQVTAGAAAGGTANLKIQDASTDEDADYADLLTTGDIDVGTAPVSGVVPLTNTASVKRYLRWAVALNTATSVTFALAFVRGRKV